MTPSIDDKSFILANEITIPVINKKRWDPKKLDLSSWQSHDAVDAIKRHTYAVARALTDAIGENKYMLRGRYNLRSFKGTGIMCDVTFYEYQPYGIYKPVGLVGTKLHPIHTDLGKNTTTYLVKYYCTIQANRSKKIFVDTFEDMLAWYLI